MNRAKIQAFGGFLTAMVIPNMGAFIAWGLITAMFIPTGWMPNEAFATLVDPMIKYLLPLLLAYTGGRRVAGDRGALIGTIGTMGVIVGSDIPMFLGAMVMGPLSALVIKKFDEYMEDKMPSGLEMLINNFSVGILGFLLCLLSYQFVGPVIEVVNNFLLSNILAFAATGYLPLLAIINEPLKVLFLNNVIEQGVYYQMGMQESLEVGKSIFFTMMSNPGPGFALLMAYSIFGNGSTKESAKGATIIQLIGGIHEIYFPYVLMKPIMLVPMIAGSMTGIFLFQLFGVGLVAAPSPGSIISYMTMTAKGDHIWILLGVAASIAVTFVLASMILKASKPMTDEDLEASAAKAKAMKEEGNAVLNGSASEEKTEKTILESLPANRVPFIVFACDAGLGSSALGANAFNKKCKKKDIEIQCKNFAIEKMPEGVDIAVIHKNFEERTRLAWPNLKLVMIENYLDDPSITELLNTLVSVKEGAATVGAVETSATSSLPQDRTPFVVFACDAGLGSSALGANAFNKKCKKAGVEIQCKNFAIEKMPDGVDVAVIHKNFEERTRLAWPNLRLVMIENYLDDPNISALLQELKTLQNK